MWEEIERKLSEIIRLLNKNLNWFNEEELKNTPRRITNFLKEYAETNKEEVKFTVFKNTKKYDQLIVLKDIEFSSACSHHLLPFFGKAYIGYLPNERICGVSKLARVVKKFASKPSIQEELTEEIANFLYEKLQPKFLIVVLKATHTCMKCRGVRNAGEMITSAIRGKKEYIHLKGEFFKLIKRL